MDDSLYLLWLQHRMTRQNKGRQQQQSKFVATQNNRINRQISDLIPTAVCCTKDWFNAPTLLRC